MSDERFFSQVKASLYNFTPEVPDVAYKGMRRKLWMSNFTRLSATRFNMWYLLLALAAGSAAFAYHDSRSASAHWPTADPTLNMVVSPNTDTAVANATTPVNACSGATSASCCSKAHSGSPASSCKGINAPESAVSASANENMNPELISNAVLESPISSQSSETATQEISTPENSVTVGDANANETAKPRGDRALKLKMPKPKDAKKDE